MLSRSALLGVCSLAVCSALSQQPTYSPAGPDDSHTIATLRQRIASGDKAAVPNFWAAVAKNGSPLIEPVPDNGNFSFVTFLWHGNSQTRNVVLFDGVADFEARSRLTRLDGTDVWYKTYRVRNDARFAYNLSPNDPLTSVNDIKGDDAMKRRLAMLQIDPLNPHRCPTTFGPYGGESSYVELPRARPLLWSSSIAGVPEGKLVTTSIHSDVLHEDKKLWIYTPAGFAQNGNRYPLLVLFDGDRNIDWIPKVLDLLVAQRRIPPIVAVMTDNSVPSARRTELPCNPQFADFLAKELVPWAREHEHATTQTQRTIVAGSSYGGLAAVFAALRHPEVFGNVIALSGSFWWKPDESKQPGWLINFARTAPVSPTHFHIEVGLMESYPLQIDSNRRMRDTLLAKGYPVTYFEYDGGHSFLNWSQGMVAGLESFATRLQSPR